MRNYFAYGLYSRDVYRDGVVSFRLISFRYRRQSGLGLGLGLGEMRLGEMRPNHRDGGISVCTTFPPNQVNTIFHFFVRLLCRCKQVRLLSKQIVILSWWLDSCPIHTCDGEVNQQSWVQSRRRCSVCKIYNLRLEKQCMWKILVGFRQICVRLMKMFEVA